jgi:hypothetical protein
MPTFSYRAADVRGLNSFRHVAKNQGVLTLTARGGGPSLELHPYNVVGVIQVDADEEVNGQFAAVHSPPAQQ